MLAISSNATLQSCRPVTKKLLLKMLGSLCGLDQEIGFMLRSKREAKMIIAGAELTGVHTLLHLPRPGRGAYHLGGCGIYYDEALIRTLGETVERYAQLISEWAATGETKFLSYQNMIKQGEPVISLDQIRYFQANQYQNKHFPFQSFNETDVLTWVKGRSLIQEKSVWIPAQLLFIGYQIKSAQGEPWIGAAVTTGTAAHTDKNQALINAILELIQIDSAMGHWYSGEQAPRLIFDESVRPVQKIIEKYNSFDKDLFDFHWIKNADLPGVTIACVYRGLARKVPRVAVGLGISMDLNEAMYKAYLETVGVVGLARMLMLDKQYELLQRENIYDLDSNVACYAEGRFSELIQYKFPYELTIPARAVVSQTLAQSEILSLLLQSFLTTKKELFIFNMEILEAADLGFVVPRVWSPDLLPLCLPSAPLLNHSRYLTYGGVNNVGPHPYP